MAADRTIDYEALSQDAMRGVVRAVLNQIARSGLPGDHHFYISFATQAPGVSMSRRLKEKYPEEMTIVLQHRFWDLTVTDERFEVKLTFDGIPERLVIPFKTVKVFFDPSVRFGLQFESSEPPREEGGPSGVGHVLNLDLAGSGVPSLEGSGLSTTDFPRPFGKPVPAVPTLVDTSARADLGDDTARDSDGEAVEEETLAGLVDDQVTPDKHGEDTQAESEGEDNDSAPAPGGARIVSLSDFRKK